MGRRGLGRVGTLCAGVLRAAGSTLTTAGPAAAGLSPPGTGVGPGVPPTARPWISAQLLKVERGPVYGFRTLVTGAGFTAQNLEADGTRRGTFSFAMLPPRPGRCSVGDPTLRPALGAGFDCSDRAVLDDTCRYYSAGELRPLRVGFGADNPKWLLPCGDQLGVSISTGVQEASVTLDAPCV